MEDKKKQIEIHEKEIKYLEDLRYICKFQLGVAIKERNKKVAKEWEKKIKYYDKEIQKQKKYIKELMK